MSRWKKLLLVLGVLLLVSQIPFAYRRYKLGQLNAAIQQVNSQRTEATLDDSLVEYQGVVHVHSFLGGHSKGGFREIISAAQANKLDFVVMTEHALSEFDTANMTLKGLHGGVVFINGNEVTTGSGRLLIIPGDEREMVGSLTLEQIERTPERNLLQVVAYPDEFKRWDSHTYEGVEVYNVYTNAREINPVKMFFDSLWSYRSYPDLLFANFYSRPSANLKLWDQSIANSGRRLVALAGNDAHANIGFELTDSTGKRLLGMQLDPYERSFRLVRMHIVMPPVHDYVFEPNRLLAAISAGNCFIGFDIFGDTTGFRYSARDGNESKILGDEITLEDEVHLRATLPVAGRIVLLRDGVVIYETGNTRTMEYVAKERGSYRVEAYLPQLGKPVGDQPWIISNPIYVR
ncbi:MAG TPA: hypothetical protein VJU84_12010 [Pyrinomonadaceae bacterium]|nr:hypothetical protein [Pyrinomonadaceae bacterium]